MTGYGVEVAGIYVLVDRTGGTVPVEGRTVRSLLALKVEAFEPEACPFCRQGFLPPPLTSVRVLVLTVPALRVASCILTTWCINGTLA